MDIRRSSDEDMENILIWLAEENEMDKAPHTPSLPNFWCNKDMIVDSHNEQNIFILAENVTSAPMAYVIYNKIGIDILEVQYKYRRQGIGEKLANYVFEYFQSKNLCLCLGECSPPTSIPFWEKMGFHIQGTSASKVIKYINKLPKSGESCNVRINWYTDNKLYESNVCPIEVHTPRAIILDNNIYLEERSIGVRRSLICSFDLVVEILIDDEVFFIDKAKYDDSQKYGIECDSAGTYYIDVIQLKPPVQNRRNL